MKWNFFTKLQLPPEPLTRGLPPPDPPSLCPLSSIEFVEPPPNKIPGYATDVDPPVMCRVQYCALCTTLTLFYAE